MNDSDACETGTMPSNCDKVYTGKPTKCAVCSSGKALVEDGTCATGTMPSNCKIAVKASPIAKCHTCNDTFFNKAGTCTATVACDSNALRT